MFRIMNSHVLLICIGSEKCLVQNFTGDPGKESKTGIINSIILHEIPTVEFDFVTISVTVCDG